MNSREMLHPAPVPTDPELATQRADDEAAVREALAVLIDKLDELLPEGRYKSLAMTMIETAAMWATKSITHRR